MRILSLVLICSVVVSAQPRKTVFLITDAEGVAGVCRQDQTDAKNSEMRQLLTGEINAAVEGFYAGGPDEVILRADHSSESKAAHG
jgi:D-amino peptidase